MAAAATVTKVEHISNEIEAAAAAVFGVVQHNTQQSERVSFGGGIRNTSRRRQNVSHTHTCPAHKPRSTSSLVHLSLADCIFLFIAIHIYHDSVVVCRRGCCCQLCGNNSCSSSWHVAFLERAAFLEPEERSSCVTKKCSTNLVSEQCKLCCYESSHVGRY
jgi:hypothetical protein